MSNEGPGARDLRSVRNALVILAFSLGGAGNAAAAPLDAGSARAFVESVYGRYQGAEADTFAPLSEEMAPKLFEASTAKLIAAGSKPTDEEEVGPLDFDPICTCQDPAGVQASVTAEMVDAKSAKAVATVRFPGQPAGMVRQVRFDLVAMGGQWRIWDLHEEDLPSLRELMAQTAKAAK